MAENRLQKLHAMGQSIWLDSIDRTMLHDGELERRIREDFLTGMTSNPTIFQKALSSGEAYDEQLTSADGSLNPSQLFERYTLAISSDVLGWINFNPSRVPAEGFALEESHDLRLGEIIRGR